MKESSYAFLLTLPKEFDDTSELQMIFSTYSKQWLEAHGLFIRDYWNQLGLFDHGIDCFIFHGGYGSYQEALWKQVPMISIPIWIDQYLITEEIVRLSLGTTMSFDDSPEYMRDQILFVLANQDQIKQRMLQFACTMNTDQAITMYLKKIDDLVTTHQQVE